MSASDLVARFLRLHVDCLIVKWQWLFRESMLRATTDTGETATITRADVAMLIEAGIIELHEPARVKIRRAA